MNDLKDLLDAEARRINSVDFIGSDPVQFPRMFTDARDAEIAALLAATLAWGRRDMICRDCQRMFSLMDWQPYAYVADEGSADLPDDITVHRASGAGTLKHYLRGLRAIYSKHGSLEAFAASVGAPESAFPSWHMVEAMNAELARANEGRSDSRCLPLNVDATALKRVNMALRWLVRRDGIVDLGLWQALKPSQLFVPLDVHVGNVSRELGLLARRQNDRKATVELTERLREFDPEDPVKYDFALFGIGVERGKADQSSRQ